MADTRYLRNVCVTIGDDEEAIAVKDLLVRFKIRRELTGTPAEGTIDIYNLTQENEARIKERAVRVLLEAGYQDDLEQVFDGVVRRVERLRGETDRITRVHVGSKTLTTGPDQSGLGRAVFVRTYEGSIPVKTIVRDGVETAGLEVGNLDLIPEDAVEVDFQYSGEVALMLSERLRPLGLQWYEEDGIVSVSRYRMSADDRPEGVTVSEQTGMIGTPVITDDGVRVATLLDPRIKLDARVRIESAFAGAEVTEGTWKAIVLTHAGDNRTGNFTSQLELRPVS